MRRQSRNIMTPTYARPLRNNWGLLLYGLNSVQISTTCSKTKHKKTQIVRYLQAPWQCRVPRCPGLCIGRCPRGPFDRLHLVAVDPAPESHTSCSAAGFMRREKLSFVSHLHASASWTKCHYFRVADLDRKCCLTLLQIYCTQKLLKCPEAFL